MILKWIRLLALEDISKAVLLTLLDRKSRFLWAYQLKDRTAATVNEALTEFLTTFKQPGFI